MKNENRYKCLIAQASAAVVTLMAGGGVAPLSAQEDDLALDEIIVTAQKREQSLQDVPISVVVETGESMRDNVITDLEELTEALPNINVSRGSGGDNISIRGVGSGTNPGFTQSVGTFVDGVYRARSVSNRASFLDLERIEVLRGPQPVYFGNSTIGGAFNIISADPGEEWAGYVMGSYEFESSDEMVLQGAVGGPVSDTVGIRIAYKHQESDGFLTDTVYGGTLPIVDNDAVRATVVVSPSDNFSASLKIEYSENREEGGTRQVVDCAAPTNSAACNPAVRALPGFESNFDFNTSIGGVFPNGLEQQTLSNLEILNGAYVMNFEFENHTLRSVTGLAKYENDRLNDVDSGPLAANFNVRTEDFEQWSQEIKLFSSQDQRLRYMVGVYADWTDFELDADTYLVPIPARPPSLAGGYSVLVDYTADTTGLGIFGGVEYDITDQITFVVGGRWSEVEVEAEKAQALADLDRNPLPANLITAIGNLRGQPRDEHLLVNERTDSDFNPSVELQWDPIDDVRFYVSYKEGFKVGGFDPLVRTIALTLPDAFDPNGGFVYDEETAEAWEIGVKSKPANNLTINLAVFQSDYEDLQVSTFNEDLGGFTVSNAGGARSRGVEVEFVWRPIRELTVRSNFAFLEAEYTDYPGAGCNTADRAAFTGMGSCRVNLAGRTLPNAPDFSGNLALTYRAPIGGGYEVIASADAYYTSDFMTTQNQDPEIHTDSYTKVNFRLGLEKETENGDSWQLGLFGRNITDELIWRWRGRSAATTEEGRQIGVQARYNF